MLRVTSDDILVPVAGLWGDRLRVSEASKEVRVANLIILFFCFLLNLNIHTTSECL